MKMPRPPLAIAVPVLGYLLLETWRFWQDMSPALGLRLATVACLIIGALYERSLALLLWMLYSGFLAMIFFSQALGLGRTVPSVAMGDMALAFGALANAGYLFFFHRRHAAAAGGER